jgi:hypothetical protein
MSHSAAREAEIAAPEPNGFDEALLAAGMHLRVPPQSIEAESALLGELLLNNSAWTQLDGRLHAGHFYVYAHSLIFGAIASMLAKGQPVDVITVHDHLKREGVSEHAGGLEYLNTLAQTPGAASKTERYVEIVRECATSREAIGLHNRAIEGHFRRDPLSLRDAAEATKRVALLEAQDTDVGSDSTRLRALTIDLGALAAAAVPPPAFVIPDWLPEGCVTLLAAHGQGGKSQVALYLAICIAAGRPVFGHAAKPPRRVLVYSCEDNRNVLEWRVQQYCAALEVDPADLVGWLFVIEAGELEDPELYVEQRHQGALGALTRAYREVRHYVEHEGIDIIVVDNASDTFAANEISRAAVRAFVRSLQHLLPEKAQGAVLLLAHVNRSASASNMAGQQYSGSTAWHNSVRSRWELTRGKADDDEDHEDAGPPAPYILKRAKGNYAAPDHASLTLHWDREHGVILPDAEVGPVVRAIERRNDERDVLAALVELEPLGQRISTNVRANNNAAKILGDCAPTLPRRLREMPSLLPVLKALQAKGFIETGSYKGTNRGMRTEWVVTDAGRAQGIS